MNTSLSLQGLIAACTLEDRRTELASNLGDSRPWSARNGENEAIASLETAGVPFIGVCCRPTTSRFSLPCGVVLVPTILRGEFRMMGFFACGVLLSKSYRFGERHTLMSGLADSCSLLSTLGEWKPLGDLAATRRNLSRRLMPPWGDFVVVRLWGVFRRGLFTLWLELTLRTFCTCRS